MVRALRAFILLAVAAAVIACEVKETKAPPLAGPSELGLSLTIQASPDVLSQDGASQSTVNVLARDAAGQPARNVSLRLDVLVDNQYADFGTLSSRTITTGSDGRALAVYTAPPASAFSATENVVVLLATPIGTDHANSIARAVSIRVVPSIVIEPISGAYFTVTPASPKVLENAVLDASASTVGEGRTIVKYEWSFGDGEKKTRTEAFTNHDWVAAGSYAVSLTITDNTAVLVIVILFLSERSSVAFSHEFWKLSVYKPVGGIHMELVSCRFLNARFMTM